MNKKDYCRDGVCRLFSERSGGGVYYFSLVLSFISLLVAQSRTDKRQFSGWRVLSQFNCEEPTNVLGRLSFYYIDSSQVDFFFFF